MVEDSQSNGCFTDPPGTNKSDRGEVLDKINDPLDQLVAPKTGPWWWGRGFAECARCKYEIPSALAVEVADLIRVCSVDSEVDKARVILTEQFMSVL